MVLEQVAASGMAKEQVGPEHALTTYSGVQLQGVKWLQMCGAKRRTMAREEQALRKVSAMF